MNLAEIEPYIQKYMSRKRKSLEQDTNAADNDNDDLNKNDISFNTSIVKKDVDQPQSLIKKSFEKYSNTKSNYIFNIT
jgi:hypothetical protein